MTLSDWLVLSFGFWVLIVPFFMFLSIHTIQEIPLWYSVSWFLSILLGGPLLGLAVTKLEKAEGK